MNGIARAIDGVIATVAPQMALKRLAARQKAEILNSGYSNYGASTHKKSLIGWNYAGGSWREDINDNLSVLRQRSRDIYMGVPIGRGAVNTMRTNVVGRGLMLKPTVDAEALGISEDEKKELEKKITREWALWAESPDCDMARLDNFYELQQLAFLNWLASGDTLALLPVKPRTNQPYDLRVQLIEADRLSSPNDFDTFDNQIVGGVEVDKDGEVVAYHFAKHHPLSYANERLEWQRVEAYGKLTGRRNVLHLMNRERIDQRRGVPFLAPVIEALKQLGRYTDAELVAAVVSGMFTVFIEKTDNSAEDAIGAAIPEEEQVDAEDETTLELAPGAIMDLGEGEKAHDVNPGRPNTNFNGFVEAICQQIGAALEIPYELLMKRFNSSYSASRGALEEAWKMFKMYRSWLANDFCQPIYEEWFAEAVAKGRIKAPGFFADPIRRKAYCKAQWNGPARGLLNPVQEVNAAVTRVNNGFSTRSNETMEMAGGDFYSNCDQLKQEEEALREVKKIASSTGEKKQQPAEPQKG
ncbi:phage portal protein [Enterocloster clostridioformis]|uniref:phage portal protein n=1 Tax=Enterocloster clostridioformis TaxID=1531 RepID=UPI000B0301DF|nr:phage portal protein [Enterocloster clostridioformis]OXE68792.1 phage portal protein [Enterocloster clostridioformis]QQR02607.1 phage portal protein [Enterocloster clostridioformis]